VAFAHGFNRFLAGRVEQSDQAKQDEVLRQVGSGEAPDGDRRILEPGQPQHTFALAGEHVRGLREMTTVERHLLSGNGLLPVAVIEDDLRRPFDQEHVLIIGGLVKGRHEFVV
jgi:hypothetical protein